MLSRINVLVIDDWAMAPLSDEVVVVRGLRAPRGPGRRFGLSISARIPSDAGEHCVQLVHLSPFQQAGLNLLAVEVCLAHCIPCSKRGKPQAC